MKNFAVLSPEGDRLLKETDTSRLSSFLLSFRDQIVNSLDTFPTGGQWRNFFSERLARAPGSEKSRNRARARVEDFIRWYEDVMATDYDNDHDDIPKTLIQQIVGVPESEFDFSYRIPDICMKILTHHTPLIEPFLTEDLSQETRFRVIQACMARTTHPLGFVRDKESFRWISSHGYFCVMQNIHGDLHVSQCDFETEPDLFSPPSTLQIRAETWRGFQIWQYPTNFVWALCHYALLVGHIPHELSDWRRARKESRYIIPFAAEAWDSSNHSLEYTVLTHAWDHAPTTTDKTGQYRYIGNSVNSVMVALKKNGRLVFLREATDGGVSFEHSSTRFTPVLELGPADIGPALRAVYHLPGRSTRDIDQLLGAFDRYQETRECSHKI